MKQTEEKVKVKAQVHKVDAETYMFVCIGIHSKQQNTKPETIIYLQRIQNVKAN